GSSVTLRLGVIFALNVLAGKPLRRARIFELCAALEGHPDNAAPAAFGGFTVAGAASAADAAELPRFAVAPRLKFVLLVPAFEIRTSEARALLPETVARLAAVASSARTSRITAAFAAARYEWLGGGNEGSNAGVFTDDAFHQTHRLPLIPFLPAVIQAGVAAGALGGFLSGSGSTIACLTLESPRQVAAAMRAAVETAGAAQASLEQVLITTADNRGAQLVPA
ncbi:MAG: hypothetical protein JO295_01690, partial [Verrucomicrobia bacterium]|nr:hypothetical protein [Verrucomicrobiota bacterium]